MEEGKEGSFLESWILGSLIGFYLVWHIFIQNAKLPLYLNKSWQFWQQDIQNCLLFLKLSINTDHYFFSSVLNKKFQRSDWLVSTMKGEKIITQPWWCQSCRNFIWNFWRLNGQLDAWNQDHLNDMWCQNICQAKLYTFIFKLSKFNFSKSRSWRILKFHFDMNFLLFWFCWILNFGGKEK